MNKNILIIVILIVVIGGGILAWHFWPEKEIIPEEEKSINGEKKEKEILEDVMIREKSSTFYEFENPALQLYSFQELVFLNAETGEEVVFDPIELASDELISHYKEIFPQHMLDEELPLPQYYLVIGNSRWQENDYIGEIILFSSADPPMASYISEFEINTEKRKKIKHKQGNKQGDGSLLFGKLVIL